MTMHNPSGLDSFQTVMPDGHQATGGSKHTCAGKDDEPHTLVRPSADAAGIAGRSSPEAAPAGWLESGFSAAASEAAGAEPERRALGGA